MPSWVAGDQSRIIIPTVLRDDYVGALRRLTRAGDASILITALRYAQDYTARIDFTDRADSAAQLARTHAFSDPDSVDRLTLPN